MNDQEKPSPYLERARGWLGTLCYPVECAKCAVSLAALLESVAREAAEDMRERTAIICEYRSHLQIARMKAEGSEFARERFLEAGSCAKNIRALPALADPTEAPK